MPGHAIALLQQWFLRDPLLTEVLDFDVGRDDVVHVAMAIAGLESRRSQPPQGPVRRLVCWARGVRGGRESPMVRAAAAILAISGLLGVGRGASAATFFFQAVQTTETAICPAPCYQVRMFYEDRSRTLPIQAVQFFVKISGSATVGSLPVPPARNSNAERPEMHLDYQDGSTFDLWNLAGYGAVMSLNPDFEVMVINAGEPFVTLDAPVPGSPEADAGTVGLQGLWDSRSACSPTSSCDIAGPSLAVDRIYLGRFNVTWYGGAVGARVALITGNGAGVLDPADGLVRFEGVLFDIVGLPTLNPVTCPAIFGPAET